jgi:hypothetical protein
MSGYFNIPMSEYLNNAKASIGNATESITQNLPDTNAVASKIAEGANSIRETTQNATADFSYQGAMAASQDFLNSNSMIARFVFVILVLIVFLFLLNLGVGLVTYLVAPSKSPYIIHGMLSGTDYTIFPQDPASGKSIVYRSNNQTGGTEFTWSVWLKVDVMPSDSNYHAVFIKGSDQYDTSGVSTINNGPGVYLYKENGGATELSGNQLKMLYKMDVASPDASGQLNSKKAIIPNLPIGKWFHVAIRLQNKTLDCYVNGVISNRLSFNEDIPKQNYDPIVYAGNGGFSGATSNLRYYDYALSVFEIIGVVFTIGLNFCNSFEIFVFGTNSERNTTIGSVLFFNHLFNTMSPFSSIINLSIGIYLISLCSSLCSSLALAFLIWSFLICSCLISSIYGLSIYDCPCFILILSIFPCLSPCLSSCLSPSLIGFIFI